MIVVASTNGKVGIKEAMRVLKAGGSAIDAVEAGIRPVEDNPDDHTVGYGGWPNILGEMEFDASIMNGRTLEAGAVGALAGYRPAISVARKVMEKLPHVFLAGNGAARFAGEMGFQREDLLTDVARERWREFVGGQMPPEKFERLAEQTDLWKHVLIASDPEKSKGTVNFIAQDAHGDICSGVSTSGWAWKYPGRLGDSPVIGAGNYADNRYGAAACTGMGEMSIRAGTARSVVLYMQMGMALEEACRSAMEDLKALGGPYISDMNLVALDRNGRQAAFTNVEGKTYIYITDEMTEPREEPRTLVPMEKRWG